MRKLSLCIAAALLAPYGGLIDAQQDTSLSFFITSAGTGDGANLGSLSDADVHCLKLAVAAGASGRTWRAYLGAVENGKPVNARDRIGTGPWFNAKGVQVASSVADLHSEILARLRAHNDFNPVTP